MRRRPLLVAAAAIAAGMAGCATPLLATAQPVYRVSQRQLQQVLDQRFPLRYAVPDLLDLRIEAPRLRLLPEQNRIASELAIEASGPALRRSYSANVELDFALRYEPGDMTIRAHRISVQAVRLPGLAPDAAAFIDAYIRASVQRALLEVVLHTLGPKELALADAMGLQPGPITVTAEGLLIGFVPREPSERR